MNERVIKFMEEWSRLAAEYKAQGKGVRPHTASYQQRSLNHLSMENYKNSLICKVLPLDEKIYNCEHIDRLKWRQIVRKYHPKIIHFKKNTYRNKDFVAEIFWLAGITKAFPFVVYCKKIVMGIKKKYLFLKERLFKKRSLADLRRILRKVMSLRSLIAAYSS